MSEASPLPLTTIAGYLGSGKTTLVNHLLRNANGLRLAILVNEFGELPIDADLIEAQDDDIIAIAGGCICCSYGNDLTLALMDMVAMDPRPDHVVIEASGVAIPSAITASVGLLQGFRSDGIIILADAETVQKQAKDRFVGDTVERQIRDANVILLNKIDLVDEARVTELTHWLGALNPTASVVPVSRGQAAPATVLESFLDQAAAPGPHHRAEAFAMHVLTPPEGTDARDLAQTLAAGDMGIVRAKGFCTQADGSSDLIQVVGQRFEVTKSSSPHPAGVVCLGMKDRLDVQKLQRLNYAKAL